MTRSDLICKSTLSEFALGYHVEAATRAIDAAQNTDRGAARAYGCIARAWLKDYIASK